MPFFLSISLFEQEAHLKALSCKRFQLCQNQHFLTKTFKIYILKMLHTTKKAIKNPLAGYSMLKVGVDFCP